MPFFEPFKAHDGVLVQASTLLYKTFYGEQTFGAKEL